MRNRSSSLGERQWDKSSATEEPTSRRMRRQQAVRHANVHASSSGKSRRDGSHLLTTFIVTLFRKPCPVANAAQWSRRARLRWLTESYPSHTLASRSAWCGAEALMSLRDPKISAWEDVSSTTAEDYWRPAAVCEAQIGSEHTVEVSLILYKTAVKSSPDLFSRRLP